jgi:hypothetical protein
VNFHLKGEPVLEFTSSKSEVPQLFENEMPLSSGEFHVYGNVSQLTKKITTGNITGNDVLALVGLIDSPYVFITRYSQRIPIRVLNTKLIGRANQNIFNYEIEFIVAFQDSVMDQLPSP